MTNKLILEVKIYKILVQRKINESQNIFVFFAFIMFYIMQLRDSYIREIICFVNMHL